MANDMKTLKVIASNGTFAFPVKDQTARDAAVGAQTAADGAQTAAQEAKEAAQTAQGMAQSASNAAGTAQQTAAAAQATAQAAKQAAEAITIPTVLPNPFKLMFTGGVTGEYDGSKAVTINIPTGGEGGGSGPVQYVESLDESNLANLRDLTTGTYVLYGYFVPFAGSSDAMTCDNTLVSVAHLSAGSHVLVFNPLNCKVNFIEILVDESAASGFTYSVQIIDMRDLPALIDAVGSRDSLATEDKSTIVAAINEVAQKGGTVTDEQIASAVEDYMAEHPMECVDAVKTVNGVAPDENGNVEITIPDSGQNANGLSATASALLITILRNGVYSTDQSANITALETALGSSGGEDSGGSGEDSGGDSGGDTPEIVTYTVTAELVNVTSSNGVSSVTEGTSYTATLTAAEGYALDSVVVLMGGVDVTADVYTDGVISIPAVTGNVEIVASASVVKVEESLPENGLVDFFDMRNATGTDESGGKLAIYATNGIGSLYTWSSTALTESNEYGAKLANRDWTLATSENLGDERTVFFMSYNGCVSYRNMLNQADTKKMACMPMYTNSSDKTISGTSYNVEFTPLDSNYLYPAVRCDVDTLSLFTNNEKLAEYNASEFEDFSKWAFPPVRPRDTNPYLTAMVIYNRALSDSEMVDVVEYLKTLEVTA